MGCFFKATRPPLLEDTEQTIPIEPNLISVFIPMLSLYEKAFQLM